MSAPSDNMPIASAGGAPETACCCGICRISSAPRSWWRWPPSMQFDGYILNILMQATTFAIAVFGLSVVLGLCGQINLAQAAFFGFGAYAVGIGTTDSASELLALPGRRLRDRAAGRRVPRRMSTLRLGGHYLAMVTISFQQIVTLVMINAIWLTHGPDGVSNIGRPALFQILAEPISAFCVAMLAIVGYLVWHLPDTRLGRAMRAVRDNELAAGVNGIDVFRTKVYAFALCAVLGGLAGGLFAGGFAYVSPDQFSFAESIVFLTMSLLGGVASPIGSAIGTGSVDPDSGMAAVPQEHSRALSRDLRPVRHPDHPLHARRHLGIRQRRRSIAGAARPRRRRPAAHAAIEARDRRRRHRARGDGLLEIFRRPQGGRWRRYRRSSAAAFTR